MQLKATKSVVQEYWESLPSEERRWILSHVVTTGELPTVHPIFNKDDLPYSCVKAWLEETIAKKDWNLDYSQNSCCCS